MIVEKWAWSVCALAGGLQIGCIHYSYSPGPVPNSTSPIHARIALVGFRPYSTTIAEENWRSRRLEADVDYGESLAPYMGLGKPVREIPSTGLDRSVPQTRTAAVIHAYLSEVGRTGIPEMSAMFEQVNGSHFLRQRDVDYYLVGIHQPGFEMLSPSCLGLLSYGGLILSLGLLPASEERLHGSLFILYDNKLEEVRRFRAGGAYRATFSWWIAPTYPYRTIYGAKKAPPRFVWVADIWAMERELRQFLGGRKMAGPNR